jgi:hypothetical protein
MKKEFANLSKMHPPKKENMRDAFLAFVEN